MKPKSIQSLLAVALLAPGALFAQTTATTTPVGYVTNTLPAGQFSFVGLTLHHPIVATATATAVTSTTVTASAVNFDTLLGAFTSASPRYILELADGSISEVTNWNASGVLTVKDNLTSLITPSTTSFKLRKAATISDVFGANNSAGLKADTDGDYEANADLVYVIGDGGVPTIVYYYNDGSTTGWFTAGGDDATNLPIVYADGFYVKRQTGSSINLVVSGEIKKAPTKGVLLNGYNFISSVAPIGSTLGNSQLKDFVSPDTTGDYEAPDVDNILLPQSNGSFLTAYYYNDGSTIGWFTASGDDATELPINGGFIILNRGVAKPYTVAIPSFYSNL